MVRKGKRERSICWSCSNPREVAVHALIPSRTGWRRFFFTPAPQLGHFVLAPLVCYWFDSISRFCSRCLRGSVSVPRMSWQLFVRVISWVSPCNLGLNQMKWWFTTVICCLGSALPSPILLSARWLRT